MKHVKISLIDNDQSVQAMADLNFNSKVDKNFSKFIEQLMDELGTGQTAYLEIDGLLNKPVVFSISESFS
jgi:hypothetical protein